jgi:hypothetical protein
MSIKEAISKYLNKSMTSTELIRMLSGMFNPDIAVDLLVVINQVCRHEQGDLDTETFKSLYEIN